MELQAEWRRSCLTAIETIDHGPSMLQLVCRAFDLALVALIFSALT